jgi:hypothetical protein
MAKSCVSIVCRFKLLFRKLACEAASGLMTKLLAVCYIYP